MVLTLLLAACLISWFVTRDSAVPKQSSRTEQPLVDTSVLQTALGLAPLAATSDEQEQAREAWHLADHELDLTYAGALREAESEAKTALPAKGPLRDLSNRIGALKADVDADKKRVDSLGQSGGDALDMAQAQLDLDQDELDDANADMSREGGSKHDKLQRLLQEHEASDKVADQTIHYGVSAPTYTAAEQLRAWQALGDYDGRLEDAAEKAATHSRMLLNQHDTLERQLPTQPETAPTLDRLHQLAAQRKTLSELDQRMQDTKQLASVYQAWSLLVEGRRRGVLHQFLQSLAVILAILLVGLLLNQAIGHAFHQSDRRRLHQLRVITRTALQVIAVVAILLIIFGPPTQLSTIIGLATAGLTVVMKDFIVAFFGWFTLMGKNGISVGDWVEIEGVSGEVIEIGLLKTVLLELGNWTETGHPTGRRVAFSNSFAMERHYFNFSTSGQWLWDELQVVLPASDDPYQSAERIREIVDRETKEDAAQAAEDWKRVTQKYGAREFSSGPAVNLRPGPTGLEVVVRYITHAPNRNIVKAHIQKELVQLLHKRASA